MPKIERKFNEQETTIFDSRFLGALRGLVPVEGAGENEQRSDELQPRGRLPPLE